MTSNGTSASKTVKLPSRGVEVHVIPVPPYAVSAAQSTIPMPKPPVLMVDSVAGHQEPWSNAEDPQYKADLAEAQAARGKLASEFTVLYALPDVQVPDDEEWFAPLADLGLKHRDGKRGRKLDYIQFYLLASNADWEVLWSAISDLTYVKEERIAAHESSFRDNGERTTAHGNAPAR